MDSNLGKLSCSCECGTSFDFHIPLGYGELNVHCPICKKYVETVEITGDVYSRKISVSKNVGIKLER